MEYLLLRLDPAELVRLVDGLTGLPERVDLRSGGALTLLPTSLPRDDSRRVDLDRILQSALMNHATEMRWLVDYDNTGDHDDTASAMRGDSRMPLDGFCQLWGRLRGRPYVAVSTTGVDPALVAKQVDAAAQRERVAVLTAFTGPSEEHWLAVEKVADGPQDKRWVYLRNPWGHDDGSGPPPRWPLPEGGGRVGMVIEDFAAILRGTVLPG